MSLDCGHDNTLPGGKVCSHLLEGEENTKTTARYFTGHGKEYYLLCESCARNIDQIELTPRTVCSACFATLDDEFDVVIVGKPEVLERTSTLSFTHEHVQLQDVRERKILDIQPVNRVANSLWLALFDDGELAQINLTDRLVTSLYHLQEADLPMTECMSIAVSDDTQILAIAHKLGSKGIVVDVTTGQITLRLDRGNYHPEQSPFPKAFFRVGDALCLVLGTSWNRLDVSNPRTGQLLTARTPAPYQRAEARREHYLDYFHSQLVISPDQEWVAEYGWAWTPAGIVRSWSMKKWMEDNIWEPEDGDTVRYMAQRWSFWDGPICWIDNRTLAVWGYGSDGGYLIPAVQLWDVVTGNEIRWFAGPHGWALFFDQYLFSVSLDGMDVWDIQTGERLLHEPGLTPIHYHHGAKQFLSVMPDGWFRLSCLNGAETE